MTNNGAPRPVDWKELYQLAVIELDPIKLPQRIAAARTAILDRIEETLTTEHHYSERQELNDALNGLRVIHQDYLLRIEEYGEPRPRKAG